jgi:hypothetical protein
MIEGDSLLLTLHDHFAIKTILTHPNPSFLVGKHWPWSIDKHGGVLWVA